MGGTHLERFEKNLLRALTMMGCLVFMVFAGALPAHVRAQDDVPDQGNRLPQDVEKNATQTPAGIEDLVRQVLPAMVTIRGADRNGDDSGIGAGFVIDQEGLIATNFHVINEGRPFTVELWPHKRLPVVAVEASDREQDLAIIRVNPDGHELKSLAFAETEGPEQGAFALAFGNPLGLEHSVVRGLVSAVREVQGQAMIQLAMPIQPGNSGGPLLDQRGKVMGIINMKSAVDDNLGFAIPVQRLIALRDHPNPVTIDRWVRLNSVDPKQWTPLFGATWRQQSGRILVSGTGSSFGGRSLCLYGGNEPALPFEVEVEVKLDDERGAAGLVFHSDGEHRHYGFYPSNGKLRLSCFKGPDVFSWQVLHEVSSAAYRPGQWNQLRVRVDDQGIHAYVNHRLVLESNDPTFAHGRVGLAKFRETSASFRRFHVGKPRTELDASFESSDWYRKLKADAKVVDSLNTTEIAEIASSNLDAPDVLKTMADEAEQLARRLRLRSEEIRIAQVLKELSQVLEHEDAEDLTQASLLIAKLDEPDVDVQPYLDKLRGMAEEVQGKLHGESDEIKQLKALDHYLFRENGYHGGRQEYYHRANSHLSRVIDDREGMPITLAILYIDLARRLGVKVEGIGLPGHFVVGLPQPYPEESAPFIDVFEQANRLTLSDVKKLVRANTDRALRPEDLLPQSTSQILTRVLHNLIGSAERSGDEEAMWRYSEALCVIDAAEVRYRAMRAIIRYRTERLSRALEDIDWILENQPVEIDLEQFRALQETVKNSR